MGGGLRRAGEEQVRAGKEQQREESSRRRARRQDRTRLRNPALTPILNQAGLAAFDFASAASSLGCWDACDTNRDCRR